MDAHERRALPEGWEWKRLGDVITYKKGRKPVTLLDEETQGSLQYLTAEYFRTGNSKNFVPKEEFSKCILCGEHDIILIWDGSNAGDIFNGLNGVVASTMIKIEPKKNLLNIYAHFFLKTQFQNFKEHTNGSSIPHVSKSSFDNTKIPLLPLPTQRRIVSILEKAEETKKLRAQADELTDRLLQSVFLEMFGDPVRNPKGWEREKLGDVLSENPQNGLYKPSTDYGGGTPILRIDSFYDGKITNIERLKRLKCTQEEIEMPRTNILNSIYMTAFLCTKYLKNQILSRAKKAVNQASINQGDVTSLPILLPPLPLQQKFARIVEKVEAMRQSQNQSKQQMEDLFSALMQKAFRGDLDKSIYV